MSQENRGDGKESAMCEARSPRGTLPCVRPDCDGHGHVFIHPSSAPDAKAEAEGLQEQ